MGIKKLFKQLKDSDGTAFQTKFTEIMKKINGSNFQDIQVYNGDKKVDGVLNGITAFAVHAPEVYKDAEVLKKLTDDYNGFLKHKENNEWSGITEWVFVIKSKRKGVTANVTDFISNKNGKDGLSTKIWTLTDIKQMVDAWVPEKIPKKLRNEIRSKILQVKKAALYLIRDYNENKDILYYSAETENLEKRTYLFSQLAYLISEIEQFYHNHLGAFEELKIEDTIQELIDMSPVGITFIDLHEGYQKINKVDNEDKYLIISICDELEKVLK